MEKARYVCFLAVVIAAVLFISCDMENGKDSKPWSGKDVFEMMQGGSYLSPNHAPSGKAGTTLWYYINAKEDMTYEIGYYLPIFYWEQRGKPTYAASIMTCYKEDGTIIVSDKEAIGSPIHYYSPNKQKIYISFTFLTDGFIAFRYFERDDYHEYDDDEYYR